MGTTHPPLPVKLFVGMLSADRELFDQAATALADKYGPVDLRSEPVPWKHTGYYRDEMGESLFRCFLFFERLADPGVLPAVKRTTNFIEEQFSSGPGNPRPRRINIDPGYLTEAKVVLATTKDYTHRLYIGEGIYAEVTLQYRGRSFHAIETTYPDYRMQSVITLFMKARGCLRASLGRP
jgi:hypothetical protein